MPLADRDIIITPNRGASSEPNIAFRGADTATSATITLKVYNSSTVGTVSFEGNVGQLMTVVDSMAGTIFSVNDISGIPSIEVLDTGEVRLAQYNGYVNILRTTTSTSTATGALIVAGGVGIGGNLNIGQNVNIAGVTTASGQIISTRANDTANGGGQIYLNGATGNRIDWNTNGVAAPAFTTRSAGTKLVLYPTISGSLVDYAIGINNNTMWFSVPSTTNYLYRWYGGTTVIATLESSGALTLNSGLNATYGTFSGVSTVTNTTDATSTLTGALQVRGGVGIGGNLYVGGTIDGTVTTATNIAGGAAGSIPIQSAAGRTTFIPIGPANYVLQSNGTTATWVSTSTLGPWGAGGGGGGVTSLAAGTDTAVSGSTGAVTVWNTSTLQSITSRGATTNQAISITNSTAASSTITGALIVTGGAGVGKDLYVGGSIYASNLAGIATTSTNLSGGSANTIAFQTAEGITSFVTAPTVNNTFLEWTGSAFQWSLNSLQAVTSRGSSTNQAISITNTTSSTGTTTGALIVTGGVGVGENLNVGGNVVGGGVRTTTSASAPSNPTVGDIWYNTTNDVIYRYTNDGVGNYWIDISGTTTVITPRVNNNGATTSGTITPTGDSSDQYEILGLTGTITIAAPSGTPGAGQKLTLRIKDDGTSRSISWTTSAGGYRTIGTTLPTTTTANKNIYVGCIYNATDGYWDVVAVATEA